MNPLHLRTLSVEQRGGAHRPGPRSLRRPSTGSGKSNLTDEGNRDDDRLDPPYDIDLLSEVIGRPIPEPTLRYEAQQGVSLAAAAEQLGLTAITTD